MTSPTITIGPERNVSAAARLMTENGIERLPVVDNDGKLAGIIARVQLGQGVCAPGTGRSSARSEKTSSGRPSAGSTERDWTSASSAER